MYFRVTVIRSNKTFTIVETISLAFFPCLSSKWSFHRMNHFFPFFLFFFFKLTRNTNRGHNTHTQRSRSRSIPTVNARAIFASCSMQVKLLCMINTGFNRVIISPLQFFFFWNNILHNNKTVYKLNAIFFFF